MAYHHGRKKKAGSNCSLTFAMISNTVIRHCGHDDSKAHSGTSYRTGGRLAKLLLSRVVRGPLGDGTLVHSDTANPETFLVMHD